MSIQGITGGLPTAARPGGIDIVIPGAGGFADTLTVGQIIKGRVLRHFGGDRYLVDFSGRQHVVDSAIPFNTNDLIHGRVVGLGDQVQLQRVASDRNGAERNTTQSKPAETPAQTPFGAASVRAEPLAAMLARLNAKISPEEQAVAAAAAKSVSEPALMARIAVALNRLGLAQSPALLRALYGAATTPGQLWPTAMGSGMAPQLEKVNDAIPQQLTDALSAFGELLRQAFEDLKGQGIESGQTAAPVSTEASDASVAREAERQTGAQHAASGGMENRHQSDMLARRFLNAQSGGVVSHRVSSIPLIVGNQLIEVDIAVFDQHHGAPADVATRHRQIVLSLLTPHLGHVELIVGVAGNRLRLQIRTDAQASTDAFATHLGVLQGDLRSDGWEVDQLSYETALKSQPNVAVRSVIEHLIAQDSLSRLM